MTVQQSVALWHLSRGHFSKDRLRCQVAWKVRAAAGGRLSSTLIPPWPKRALLLLIHPPRPLHSAHATLEKYVRHAKSGLPLNEKDDK